MLRPHLAIPAALAIGLAAPAWTQNTTPLPEAKTPGQAAAQYQKGYNAPNSPDATGGNAGTTSLNTGVAAGTTAQLEGNAEAQAQYANDMASYRQAVEAHARASIRDQARYDNQQRAYADAMFAWRMQVRACERGRVKACKAPTPDPADFY